MPAWPLPPTVAAIYPSTPGGITAPSLSDLQFHYGGSGGITFGAGQAVGVTQVEGLGGMPNVNHADVAFPRDSGEYVGVDAMGGRDIIIDVNMTGGIVGELAALGAAMQAGGVTEQPLWFKLPGLAVMCSMCRPRGRTAIWDLLMQADKFFSSALALHATDPRLYTQAAITSSASGAGPVAVTVTNGGNIEVRPVLLLNGPLNAPSVTLGSGSNPPALVFSSGTTIASGDTVVVDFSTPHTVQYFTGGIGGSGAVYNVYNWVDQANTSWWNLAPGASVLSCAVASGSLAASQFQVWAPGAGYIL